MILSFCRSPLGTDVRVNARLFRSCQENLGCGNDPRMETIIWIRSSIETHLRAYCKGEHCGVDFLDEGSTNLHFHYSSNWVIEHIRGYIMSEVCGGRPPTTMYDFRNEIRVHSA